MTILDTIDDPLPTAARAALLGMMGAISGVTPGTVGFVNGHATGTRIRATYAGWSPSLHSYHFDVEVNSPYRVDDDRLHRDPPASLVRMLGTQRDRLQAGIRLGLHRPLETPVTSFSGVETRHLHVDRTLVALYTALDGRFTSDIAEAIANLHTGDDTVHHVDTMRDDCSWVMETPTHRLCGMLTALRDRTLGRWVTYDGMTLCIGGAQIAETAAAVLVGRPLRDLAEVHPVLDDVAIRSIDTEWEDGHPSLRVEIEPDLIPVPQPDQQGTRP